MVELRAICSICLASLASYSRPMSSGSRFLFFVLSIGVLPSSIPARLWLSFSGEPRCWTAEILDDSWAIGAIVEPSVPVSGRSSCARRCVESDSPVSMYLSHLLCRTVIAPQVVPSCHQEGHGGEFADLGALRYSRPVPGCPARLGPSSRPSSRLFACAYCD